MTVCERKQSKSKLKFVLFIAAIVAVVNIPPVSPDGVWRVWQFMWGYLKTSVGGFRSNPDAGLDIYQFLDKYNYTLEAHGVTTEDGYILTLHRIPLGRNETTEKCRRNVTRPVVFLVHCLSCSSMDWVWQGPNRSLALLLADLGYDVWLANTRGNVYSSSHVTLTPANATFWDFSFHQKGFYDMPSSIDYILNRTRATNLTFVGHSQGTAEGLVLTTTRPEYNDKLNLMVLLSPIVYLQHLSSPLVKMLERHYNVIKVALDLFGIHGIPYSPFLSFLTDVLCNDSSSLQDLCIFLMDIFSGFDPDQVDRSRLTVYLTNTPNGVSVKEIYHLLQEVKSGKFRQYDYESPISNFVHYGSAEPPSYDVRDITVPLAVYYSKNDFLASVTNVEQFLSELNRDTVDRYLIEYDYFNHLDFINAKDVKSLLYDRVINVIQQTVNKSLP